MNALTKLGLVALGAIIIFGVGFAAGHTWCTKGQQKAVYDSIDEGAEKVEEAKEVIKWREKKVNVYVDRIKTVVDKSGCADAPIVPELDDELYEVYRLTRGPEAHRRLPVRGVSASDTPGDAPE